MRSVLRVAPIAMIISLAVPAMAPGVAFAQTVDQQRNEVERIVDELERLEEKSLDIAEDYVEALDAKAQLDQDIIDLEADIAGKEAELEELRADLGDMAVRAFVGSGTTPLGPLFEDTADVNDVLQRDELARVALSQGDVTTDELDAFVLDLEQDRTDLEDKREDAEQLAADLVESAAETEKLKTEYTDAREDAEEKLGNLIREEEERRAAESLAAIQAQIDAAAAQNAPNNSNSTNNNSASNDSGGSNNSGGTSTSGGTTGGGSSTTTTGGSSTPAAVATPAPAPEPVAPSPSSRASVAVNAALGQQGVPYKFATSSPGVNFDCSGLTKYAWAQAGVYLPHQSRAQYASIPHVSAANAQPGDLVFYYSPISHVGVYIGGGQHVHAPATGDVVKISTVNWSKVTGVGRPG